jgi:hypothetical protein
VGSSDSPLTPLELAFLERIFASVPGVRLSGGGALAVHLRHRRSLDLDLFVQEESTFRALLASLPAIATAVGGRLEILTDAPAFRRALLAGPEGEAVRVDVVWDAGLPAHPLRCGGFHIDPPGEILINKVCAILGRSELRDLVDLFFLERAGYRVLDALEAAKSRDAGLTPAGLAWAISQVPLDRLPEGLLVPLTLDELHRFRDRLVEALQDLAFPR